VDIIVTIPKTMLAQVEEEEKQAEAARLRGEEVYYFWKLGRMPKDLNVKDRCYFVWNGAIRAYHVVVGIAKDMTCQTTGAYYPGLSVVLDPVIHEVDPIPMKGFQGYRYKKT
jgi:hypothetical protein